jgi:hypothetical protein
MHEDLQRKLTDGPKTWNFNERKFKMAAKRSCGSCCQKFAEAIYSRQTPTLLKIRVKTVTKLS